MKGDIEPSCEDYIKITVCIKKYQILSCMTVRKRGCTTHDWRRALGCFCLRSDPSLAVFGPCPERSLRIGCASSPAVLQRTRSLQLGSVGSCEPRKKPCDPSQARWLRIKFEATQQFQSRTPPPRRRPWIWLRLYLGWVCLCVFVRKSCA